jgi:hypothetical protein
MWLSCLFGHRWIGCKCYRCGKKRDEQHDWNLCKGMCSRCYKPCEEQHDWNGHKCSRCGKILPLDEIQSQSVIAGVVKDFAIQYSVREAAVEKLTDKQLLEEIAEYFPQRPELVYDKNSNIWNARAMRRRREKEEDAVLREAAKVAIAQIADLDYTLNIALTKPCKVGETARNRLKTLNEIELLDKRGLLNKQYQHNFIAVEVPTGPTVYTDNGSYTEYMGTRTVYRCSVCGFEDKKKG